MDSGTYRDFEAYYESEHGPQSSRRGIGSVETGIHILTTLVELGERSSLKAITQASGLDTSQTHRYLSSLVNSGVIRQNSVTGLYDLGPKALKIGLAALSRLDPISIISKTVDQLVTQCNHTALVSIWGPNGPVIIRWYAGKPPVYTTLAIGSLMSLTGSATGRVFMSYMKDELLKDKLIEEGYKAPVAANKKLAELRNGIRKSCLASVDGTLIPGLRAYAMPVFGVHDSLSCVITLIASQSMPEKYDEQMLKDLRFTCTHLTNELGGVWPQED